MTKGTSECSHQGLMEEVSHLGNRTSPENTSARRWHLNDAALMQHFTKHELRPVWSAVSHPADRYAEAVYQIERRLVGVEKSRAWTEQK